jgi:hypothetical protein
LVLVLALWSHKLSLSAFVVTAAAIITATFGAISIAAVSIILVVITVHYFC